MDHSQKCTNKVTSLVVYGMQGMVGTTQLGGIVRGLYETNSWGVPYIHTFRFRIIWFYGDNFASHEIRIPSLNHTGWYIRLMFFWNSWLIWISKRLWDGNQFIIAVHSHCKLKESQQCHRKLLKVVAGVLMQTPCFCLSRKLGGLIRGNYARHTEHIGGIKLDSLY